jgi:hypothetical protein
MFTLFNQLPSELRLQIWELALPGPRVMHIKERLVGKTKVESQRRDSNFENLLPGCADDDMLSLRSDNILPSELFACRDFRQVALKFYVKSLALAKSTPETYFDFDVDTMYLRFGTFAGTDTVWLDKFIQQLESMYDSDDFRKVKKLAILLDLPEGRDYYHGLAKIWRWFGSFRKLTVVVSDFDQGEDDRGIIICVKFVDATKACHNSEAFAPESSRCCEIPDVLLAMIFVFAMEFERQLKERG